MYVQLVSIAAPSPKDFDEPIYYACCSSSGHCTTSKTVTRVVLLAVARVLQKATNGICELLSV